MHIIINENNLKLNKMTTQQQNTIERLVTRTEKLNGTQQVVSFDICKGHVTLYIGNVIEGFQHTRETIFCNVEINTKGNITKGFFDALRPKEWVKYHFNN